MTLFEEILNEVSSVIYGPPTETKINNAINHRNTAIIRYNSKGKGEHLQQRTIFPVAYGVTKKGNKVVRAYQTGGDTTTVKPGWKFFRLDRILSWYNMRKSRFDMRMLVNLGYNRDGDKLMVQLFNRVKTKAHTDDELGAKKEKKPQQQSTENPVITSTPVTKGEVEPQDNAVSQSGEKTPQTLSTYAKNIDNKQLSNYINSDDDSSRMTAPETVPVSKNQINGISKNAQDNMDSDKEETYDDYSSMSADGENPVSKADLESNPVAAKYKDMMNRYNTLDNEKNKEDNF